MLTKNLLNIIISALLCIGLLSVSVLADDDKYAAEVKWERYKVSDLKLSIELPKMPVMHFQELSCKDFSRIHYFAYADEIVYGMVLTFREKSKYESNCRMIGHSIEKFDNDFFKKRLGEIETNSKSTAGKVRFSDTQNIDAVLGDTIKTWFFGNIEQGIIVELSIAHRKEKQIDPSRFLRSLELTGKVSGIEIKNGSQQTLGDKGYISEEQLKRTSDEPNSDSQESLIIISRPNASYTTRARENHTTGSVRLAVTFLANGGIGEIKTERRLPNGLTEEAIKVAKQIVFLPERSNGKNITVVKKVEYNFNLY